MGIKFPDYKWEVVPALKQRIKIRLSVYFTSVWCICMQVSVSGLCVCVCVCVCLHAYVCRYDVCVCVYLCVSVYVYLFESV